MNYFIPVSKNSVLGIALLGLLSITASAQSVTSNEKLVEPELVVPDSDSTNSVLPPPPVDDEKIVVTPSYLKSHPEELEDLLVKLLYSGDPEGLKLLLPIYAEVGSRDPSLIEWGNAIILAREGKFNEAVSVYRKLISHFPEQRMIRFQLALALFYDKQFVAARSEFEKLRSGEEASAEMIDSYISAIDKQDSWNFNGSISYVHDDNINNTVEKGTELTLPSGAKITASNGRESAKGFDFSISADRRFTLQDNFYLKADVSARGKYYWDNKKYNDFNIRLMPGLGYSNAYTDISVSPFISNQWYGGGSNSDTDKLKDYVRTIGIRTEAQQWLSPQWRYQGAFEFGHAKYADSYDHLDGNNFLLSNTLMYMPNQNNYYYGGLDLIRNKAKAENNSYWRYGARLGWGHEWGRGFSTSMSAGYAKRKYDGPDFFNVTQDNNEYNGSISVWNRGWHIWDITPRLVWSYGKTDSNHPLYSYDSNKVYVDFSKSF